MFYNIDKKVKKWSKKTSAKRYSLQQCSMAIKPRPSETQLTGSLWCIHHHTGSPSDLFPKITPILSDGLAKALKSSVSIWGTDAAAAAEREKPLNFDIDWLDWLKPVQRHTGNRKVNALEE